MIKIEAVRDAQKRANMTRKDHVVFMCDEPDRIRAHHYTPVNLWGHRLTQLPLVSYVCGVLPERGWVPDVNDFLISTSFPAKKPPPLSD